MKGNSIGKSFKKMSKRYSDRDIDNILNNYINYKLEGFKKNCSFLLEGEFTEKNTNERFLVALTGAIDHAGVGIPLNFFLNKSVQRASNSGMIDYRKDVFDELMPEFISKNTAHAKILFPFNIYQHHWLTGEIILHKNFNSVEVIIYVHNPYGGGILTLDVFNALAQTINQQLGKEQNLLVRNAPLNKSPYNSRRQAIGDIVSCGVIVTDDIKKRIEGKSLDVARPYEMYAATLREEHTALLIMSKPVSPFSCVNVLPDKSTPFQLNDFIKLLSSLENIHIKNFLQELITDEKNTESILNYLEEDILRSISEGHHISFTDLDHLNKIKSYFKCLQGENVEALFINLSEKLISDDDQKRITWRGIAGFSDELHLRGLKFRKRVKNDQDIRDLPAIFEKADIWKNIPDFVLITGQNGSGKSQLLKYIYGNIIGINNKKSNYLLESEIIYINSAELLNGTASVSSGTDTSYSITNEAQYHTCIEQIKSYFLGNSEKPSDRFATLVVNRIEQQLIAQKIARENIDENYICETARKTIDYELNDLRLSRPLDFLTYVVMQYEARKKAIINQIKDISGSLLLFDYYQKLNDDEIKKISQRSKDSFFSNKLELRRFLEKISSDEIFKKNIIEHFADNQAGDPPIENINRILQKHGFKYSVTFGNEKIGTSHLVFKRGEIMIAPYLLSSGEAMALSMMTWQYYVQGLSSVKENSERQLSNRVKVMLLDEPDRHLDPKLCKLFYEIIYEEFVKYHGMQVIMSTHRTDTVALAPEKNIYMIQHNLGKAQITQVHKLQALFRMSNNFRELFDYHCKIYVESVNDAQFYESAYHALHNLCNQERKRIKREKYYYYNFNDPAIKPKRLLSNRYQMSFYSVSKKKKKGDNKSEGGCSVIISRLQEDLTALENLALGKEGNNAELTQRWLKTRKLFSDIRLYRSYGLLDNDYDRNYKKDFELSKKGLAEYITTLKKRHSLENFLFDPIIFCSTLTVEEIEVCIRASNINQKVEQEQLANGDEINIEYTEEQENNFLSACLNIKYALNSHTFELLQKYLDVYFGILFSVMQQHYYRSPEKQKPQEKPIYANMNQKIKQFNANISLSEVDIIFITSQAKTFNVTYPAEFLKVRGHDIEAFFWGSKNKCKPADKVVERVYQAGLNYIPLDLADLFFNLNFKIRRNIRAVIKPNTLENFFPRQSEFFSYEKKGVSNFEKLDLDETSLRRPIL